MHLLQIVRHFDGEDLLDAAEIWEGGVAEVTTMVLHTDPGTGVRFCIVSCCDASGVGTITWPWIEYSPTHPRNYDETKAKHSRDHVGGPVVGGPNGTSTVMTEAGRGIGNGVYAGFALVFI